MFDGAAGYAGPQCKCWAQYNPAPNAAPPQDGAQVMRQLFEADVRRIVREELDARLRNVDLSGNIRMGGG